MYNFRNEFIVCIYHRELDLDVFIVNSIRSKGTSLWIHRLIVLGILLGILEWDRSDTCILLLWDYVIGYEGLFVACMAVEFSICFLATRGSILDTTARAPMQYILYIRLCEYLYLVQLIHVTTSRSKWQAE